jgi:hypothetical protein
LLSALTLASPEASRSAETYYVSPSGNDQNDGLSPETPWRTAFKVKTAGPGFAPGTAVLFERGGQWRERLVAACSGTPEAPIIFDAYGEGPKPIFWGSEIIPSDQFSPLEGTVSTYEMAYLGDAACVFADQNFLRSAYILAGRTNDLAVILDKLNTVTNTWAYWDNVLYVNTGGPDPRTDGRLWTASVRDDLVLAYFRSNLVFRNLVVDESASDVNGYGFRVQGSRNVRVEDCEAYRAGKHHFGAIDSTGFVGVRLRAGGGGMPDMGYGGVTYLVSYSDAAHVGQHTSAWIDCEVVNEVWGQLGFYHHGAGLGDVLVQNITLRGATLETGYSETNPVRIIGGLLEAPTNGTSPANLVLNGRNSRVENVTLRGKATIFMRGQGNHLVQNCCLEQVDSHPLGAIVVQAPDSVVRFNTVVLASNSTSVPFGIRNEATNCALYGNVFWPSTAGGTMWASVPFPNVEIRDNFYNAPPVAPLFYIATSNRYVNFTQWQGLGFDTNSTVGDVRFNDPATQDFRLRLDSPAIDSLPPSAVSPPPAVDLLNELRPQGVGFDLGALERKFPMIERRADGSILAAWSLDPTGTYEVHCSSNLANWVVVTNGVQQTGSVLTLEDDQTPVQAPRCFYRAVEVGP